MADAAQATLWSFPGVAKAAPALLQIEACAKDYHLTGASPPSPTDRDAWEPLLRRAAHTLSAEGSYVDGPPKPTAKGAMAGGLLAAPRVHNCFTVWTRHEAGERGVAADCDAVAASLRALPPAALPGALGRLAGVYTLPARPPRELSAPAAAPGALGTLGRLLGGLLGGRAPAAAPSSAAEDFLFFGLGSNAAQEQVVATLATHGCAVLVGPPGTGKSQTICNVICHYLATGRRVLVTSKGEPATEVLRHKLPAGVRELCVSLGGGDSSSFRRPA